MSDLLRDANELDAEIEQQINSVKRLAIEATLGLEAALELGNEELIEKYEKLCEKAEDMHTRLINRQLDLRISISEYKAAMQLTT